MWKATGRPPPNIKVWDKLAATDPVFQQLKHAVLDQEHVHSAYYFPNWPKVTKLRAQMRIELKRLRERVATTSIYVTHDQVEAMMLGDRVVVMLNGRIQHAAPPLEIYTRPRNRFVASLIGAPAMNFLTVNLQNIDDRLHAVAENFRVRVASGSGRSHSASRLTRAARISSMSEAARRSD